MQVYQSPEKPLGDEPVTLCIQELTPLREYTVSFSTQDREGHAWSSKYKLLADDEGSIHLDDHFEYPMQYLSEMKGEHEFFFAREDASPWEITMDVAGEGSHVIRYTYARGVTKVTLDQEGIVGFGYLPDEGICDRAVIIFSGSGAGTGESRCALTATHGIPAFSVAYFKRKGLPENLEEIPLEYFEHACEYIKREFQLNELYTIGNSRGGELVLLLGAHYPWMFQKIVALVPSSATYGGMPDNTKPTWTSQSARLAIAPFPKTEEIIPQVDLQKPIAMSPFFIKGLKRREEYEASAIPVENINCKTLLISASDDQMWPSTTFCHLIQERRKTHNKPTFLHIDYPRAGHTITMPFFPTTSSIAKHPVQGLTFDNGGEPNAHAQLLYDSFLQTIAFLKQ